MLTRGSTVGRLTLASLRYVGKSNLHKTVAKNAASVFRMPAMSPTMTEGAIVSWKQKPGDTFETGDVLLEIETDKANIDVEAQDEGVMWEPLVKEKTEGIPVGQPIAFLAEPGDDLATLEKPSPESEPNAEKPAKETKTSKKESVKDETQIEKLSTNNVEDSSPRNGNDTIGNFLNKANPNQKILPAVEVLLHQNHISFDDAIARIPASGPNGRLLKGDILAYLGKINLRSVQDVAQFVASRQHLDLSNIKLAEPKTPPLKSERRVEATDVLNFCVDTKFGEAATEESFKLAFEKAIKSATKATVANKFSQFSDGPSESKRSNYSDIFDDILTPSVTKSRFEIFGINYDFPQNSHQLLKDSFDQILGVQPLFSKKTDAQKYIKRAIIEFKVKFDLKLHDSKEFVDIFQNKLISQIPPQFTSTETSLELK